jgi:hypothetical protein
MQDRPTMGFDSPEPPALDLSQYVHFIALWCEITGAPHVTLTAITPDGPTSTFTPGGSGSGEVSFGPH